MGDDKYNARSQNGMIHTETNLIATCRAIAVYHRKAVKIVVTDDV